MKSEKKICEQNEVKELEIIKKETNSSAEDYNEVKNEIALPAG